MKKLVRTFCVCFLLTNAGCGTMVAHLGDCGSRPYGVYMGTRFDAACIAAPFLSDPPMFLAVPVGVVDLPFSFTADTIIFPFDLVDYIDYRRVGLFSIVENMHKALNSPRIKHPLIDSTIDLEFVSEQSMSEAYREYQQMAQRKS